MVECVHVCICLSTLVTLEVTSWASNEVCYRELTVAVSVYLSEFQSERSGGRFDMVLPPCVPAITSLYSCVV